jgi:choline dehydrogenase
MRPNSRGTIHLTGPDPSDPLSIDANYLGDTQDLEDLITGLSMAREIGNSLALRPFTGREVAPGSISVPELEQFFRDGLVTHWHQSGTAKMGRDAMSVVDGRLKVYGVDGLRIADASILPRVTTGNTMAPCVIIGECAAAALRDDHKVEEDWAAPSTDASKPLHPASRASCVAAVYPVTARKDEPAAAEELAGPP